MLSEQTACVCACVFVRVCVWERRAVFSWRWVDKWSAFVSILERGQWYVLSKVFCPKLCKPWLNICLCCNSNTSCCTNVTSKGLKYQRNPLKEKQQSRPGECILKGCVCVLVKHYQCACSWITHCDRGLFICSDSSFWDDVGGNLQNHVDWI